MEKERTTMGAATKRKHSGLAVDYACSFSLRKGNERSRANGGIRHQRNRKTP